MGIGSSGAFQGGELRVLGTAPQAPHLDPLHLERSDQGLCRFILVAIVPPSFPGEACCPLQCGRSVGWMLTFGPIRRADSFSATGSHGLSCLRHLGFSLAGSVLWQQFQDRRLKRGSSGSFGCGPAAQPTIQGIVELRHQWTTRWFFCAHPCQRVAECIQPRGQWSPHSSHVPENAGSRRTSATSALASPGTPAWIFA